MAHDFNNLLTGVLGYARLLLDRIGPGDPIRRQLAAIETSAARAADLTSQLLTFSRRAAGRPEPVDLGPALGPTLEGIDAALPGGIELTVETPPFLWTTEVDIAQVRRIVEALCANAREAMPYGGRLSVALANRTLAAEDCRGRPDARQGSFVTLTVADTGGGVDPEVRKRLFEPFVTTKKGDPTAGFGLAIAYGLVKGHDGWIEVESERGQGTRVIVWLPARESAAAAAQPASPAPAPHAPAPAPAVAAPQGTPRTILAVDDEPTILALARDVLELNGYRVLTARNGEEAMRIYREQHATIDLVLLDLTMPVMGGAECFRQMRALRPGVRVIISSGFSAESSAAEVMREGALEFLAKPYDIQALARVVAAGLKRPDEASLPGPAVAAAS
jgi:two-component system, cell cycle sensor histidine kinase and response regulator CckA